MDTNFRSVFALSGPDRVRYLNAVTSGNIRDLAPGQSALGLALNAQGHMLAELLTLVLEDRLLVLSHAFLRQRTFETLDKFIIMDDATLTDETSQTGTLAIEGPQARGDPARNHGSRSRATPGGRARRGADASCGRRDSLPRLAPLAIRFAWRGVSAAARSAGSCVAGAWRSGARRGAACPSDIARSICCAWKRASPGSAPISTSTRFRRRPGIESTHISFTKGCYTGQEIVERVRSRGHVNRRLGGLRFQQRGGAESRYGDLRRR